MNIRGRLEEPTLLYDLSLSPMVFFIFIFTLEE